MEIIGLVGAYRHKARSHCKTVQVAGNVTVHIGQLVSVEVVARSETEIPIRCGTDVA